jgi:hypothetical protein
MAQRFRSEIKLARKVSHRNVCRIHEYGEHEGLRYICMELVDGVNLKQLVREGNGLPAGEAYDVAIQMAKGLQAIHDAGIIHRDLKTPNIMRDARGIVRLMDFGIAKQLEGGGSAGLTLAGQMIGTPEYMSPEQGRGYKLDYRTDIYSLGVVIFEVFTGGVPFRGDTPVATVFKHVQEAPALDHPRIPPPLVPVLRKALAKDPDERYATARGVAAALRLARQDVETGDTPTLAAAALRLRSASPGAVIAEATPPPGPAAGAVDADAETAFFPGAEADGMGFPGGTPTPVLPLTGAWPPGLEPLLESLRDDDKSVRWRAVLALGEMRSEHRDAIFALVDALDDSDQGVRWAAAASLGKTGPPARDAVPALAGALNDPDDAVLRWHAAAALTQIGPVAKEAVPALIGALKDERVREQAGEGLVKIGLPAVPALLEALQDDNESVRWHAANALTRIGIDR